MLKIVSHLLSCLTIYGVAYFLCEPVTWGFNLSRLPTSHDLGFENEGEDPAPYLEQKFALQAQGGQSYVFFSEDGKYVLKFFKDMPRPWLKKKSYKQKKWGKLHRTLTGYKLAFDRLLEETELITLHLKPSPGPLLAKLVDRLQIEHRVDLAFVYFVIQKRVDPLSEADFQSHLESIECLLQKREEVKIADHDPRLLSNIGWSEGHPVFIDPGRFVNIP